MELPASRCITHLTSPWQQTWSQKKAARPQLRGFSDEAAPPEEDLDDLKRQISEAKERIEQLQQKLVVCTEDAYQAQRRHKENVENAAKYAYTKFAKETLQVVDNLERAKEAVQEEDLEAHKSLRQLHAGVNHTHELLLKALERKGITKVNPVDETFDPNCHEAMFAMPMPGKNPNTIFHVVEVGYQIGERTLRPAKVGIVRA